MTALASRWRWLRAAVGLLMSVSALSERIEPNTSVYYQLSQMLFRNYHNDSRPVQHPHDQLNVTVSCAMFQIINVDQVSNSIKLSASFRMVLMQWEPINYEGCKAIFLPAKKVWTPELTVYYSVDSDSNVLGAENLEARLSFDGTISYSVKFNAHALCPYDVKKFPFDRQQCNITFGSFVHSVDTLLLIPDPTVNLENFFDNQEWILDNTVNFTLFNLTVQGYDSPFSLVMLTLAINRQPFYYVFNLVIPAALITFVAIVGFHLPQTSLPHRDAKFHLTLITLLSMSVLLFGISDKMPRFALRKVPGKRGSFSALPLLGIYYLALLVLITLGCVTTSLFVPLERFLVHYQSAPEQEKRKRRAKAPHRAESTRAFLLSTKLNNNAATASSAAVDAVVNRIREEEAAEQSSQEQLAPPIFTTNEDSNTVDCSAAQQILLTKQLLTQLIRLSAALKDIRNELTRLQPPKLRYNAARVVQTLEVCSLVFYMGSLMLILILFFNHGWYK